MCAGNSKERDVDLSTALLHEASPVVHSSTQKVRNPPVSFWEGPKSLLGSQTFNYRNQRSPRDLCVTFA
jgi:hypothetical protein